MARVNKQRDLEAPLDVLTASQARVLECLARYRFLNTRQFINLGIVKSRDALYTTVLPRLTKRREKNLVTVQAYTPQSVMAGRASFIYALTVYGAEIVADILCVDIAQIHYPVGGIQYVDDYFHREIYIDFCIALDKWVAEHDFRDVPSISHYFDHTGSNRSGDKPSVSVNRLRLPGNGDPIEPDGMGVVTTEDDRRVAFAVEIHRKTDPKRIAQQLIKHAIAASAHLVGQRFGLDKANVILSVCANPAVVERVRLLMRRAPNFASFAHLYRFNDVETLTAQGFAAGWTTADGNAAQPFA
jgi:hypothetical protein